MDAEEIRNATFRRVLWGYSPSEVHALLQQVAAWLDHSQATDPAPGGASGAFTTPRSVDAVVSAGVVSRAGSREPGGSSRLETVARDEASVGAQSAGASPMHALETVVQEQPHAVNRHRGVCQDAAGREARSLGHDEDGVSQEQTATGEPQQGTGALAPPADVPQAMLPGATDLADLARRLGIGFNAAERSDPTEQ